MQAARRTTRVWAGFALPGVVWLLALFVVPVYAVVAVAFGQIDPLLRTPIPTWNPLQWDFSAMRDVLDRVFGGDLGTVFIRTFWFVGLALAGSGATAVVAYALRAMLKL
jgi:spermidine/putrescine transport system permease protein